MTLPVPQQFASDNYAGICPEAWSAMAEANHGHASAYGNDGWTAKASDAFRTLFETGPVPFGADEALAEYTQNGKIKK